MSQSPNPKDPQALLQSMLQRLKLQPGKEGQAYLHTPVHTTAAFTWGQDGESGASNLQKVSSSPVNGVEFGTNGLPSNKFGISAADSNFGLKGEGIQKPSHDRGVDRGLTSFPSQKDNIDGDTVKDIVVGRAHQPVITPTGTGQLFPAESLKDADITSLEWTHGAGMSLGTSAITRHTPSDKDAVTSTGQNQNQDQSFKPKVYVWSLKPTEANLVTPSQENEVLHVTNGGLAQSKDTQIAATNSSSRRKQRSSESRTRRWTQKIKEKWKDRPGSFGKKGEEGGSVDKKNDQGIKISPQQQLSTAEHVINTSNKEEEWTHPSLDSNGPSNTPLTEDGTNVGHKRSTSDLQFGLGSFSLLEEIVTGQEWAMFLNPKQSATSADKRPSELKIQLNPRDSGRSSLVNQVGGVNDQCSFTGAEASPDLDFRMAQISPDAFQAVSMDVSEGKQAAVRDIHCEADQPEPMEHGHTCRSPSSEPAAILDNSALKSRVHPNRKRQHQPAHRGDERPQAETISDENEADRGGSMSLLSPTSSHVKEETGESQHDNLMPLYVLNSPPPFSPSSPFAPAPRGVLKHSISQDSQLSMETVTKRRRVEENRRVHFSEEVVAIAPPEPNLDAIDSDEDWGEEEDSVTEQECEEAQECEEGQEEIEEVAAPAPAPAPAWRPALPAWIQALKRMNTGRKHR